MKKNRVYSGRARELLKDASLWPFWNFGETILDAIHMIEADSAELRSSFPNDLKITNLLDSLDESIPQLKKSLVAQVAEVAAFESMAVGMFWVLVQQEVAKKGGGPKSSPREFIKAEYNKNPKRKQVSIVLDGLEAYELATGKQAGKMDSYVKKFAEIISS